MGNAGPFSNRCFLISETVQVCKSFKRFFFSLYTAKYAKVIQSMESPTCRSDPNMCLPLKPEEHSYIDYLFSCHSEVSVEDEPLLAKTVLQVDPTQKKKEERICVVSQFNVYIIKKKISMFPIKLHRRMHLYELVSFSVDCAGQMVVINVRTL